jgi:hypothetical protein
MLSVMLNVVLLCVVAHYIITISIIAQDAMCRMLTVVWLYVVAPT